MSAEISELKRRLDSIKADAVQFVEDMIERDIRIPRAIGVWRGISEDRSREGRRTTTPASRIHP